jgi:riboflavin synthase alpha subunit
LEYDLGIKIRKLIIIIPKIFFINKNIILNLYIILYLFFKVSILICINIVEEKGSTYYTFQYEDLYDNITIEKGSVTVNGVSLTVVGSKENEFSVAIIPYTIDNTNFKEFKKGTKVNLEFDVVGKYIKRLTQGY